MYLANHAVAICSEAYIMNFHVVAIALALINILNTIVYLPCRKPRANLHIRTLPRRLRYYDLLTHLMLAGHFRLHVFSLICVRSVAHHQTSHKSASGHIFPLIYLILIII